MSDSDPPDSASPSVPPEGGAKDSRRRRLEGVIPELFRRAVEIGVEKARESPENLKQFVGDLKVPKEIAHYLFTQIDETKNGLFRVVAKEIRDFLEHTNFAGEVQKLLTTVQFEVNTTIRFTPNNGRADKKKKDDGEGGSEGGTGGDGDDSNPESAGSNAGASGGDEKAERTVSLPRPEVKTAVHVRRDPDRARRPRGSRQGAP